MTSRLRQTIVALAAVVVCVCVSNVSGFSCREAATCSGCLAAPECGWCASYQDCVVGNVTGPISGECPVWQFRSCSAPPSVPTPAPTPDFPTKIALVWDYELGNGSTNARTSPLVCDGVVYASNSASLFAFDAQSGELLFSFPFAMATGYMSCMDGMVFVGSMETGLVSAVNITSGLQVWQFDANATSPFGNFGINAAGGRVFWGAGSGVFYALNATTGAVLWSYGGMYLAMNRATFDDYGSVYFGAQTGVFYQFDQSSGQVLNQWSFFGSGVHSPPVIRDGAVWVGCDDGYIYQFFVNSTTYNWRYLTQNQVWGCIALSDSTVYAVVDGLLLAVNASSGTQTWSYQTAVSSPGPGYGRALVYEKMVIVLADALYFVDSMSGNLLFRHSVSLSESTDAVIVNGLLYVASGRLSAFTLS